MKRILIVDDEVDIAETLQDLVELLGYAVVVAYNGEDGLRKVEETRPDVILTDVMMPVMSGGEMLQKIREHPEHKRIPIIVMSAGDGQEVAKEFGAAFLQKPFVLQQLTRVLDRLPE